MINSHRINFNLIFCILGWSVENDYIDEKEQACLALKEIAEFAG